MPIRLPGMKRTPKNKERKVVAESAFLTEKLPYAFTPSYFKHNGRWGRILRLRVASGTNRGMNFHNIIDFNPLSTLEGVQVHIFCDDTVINGDEKKRIVRENSRLNRNSLENEEEDEADKTSDTKADKNVRFAQMEDYLTYEGLLENNQPIVVFKWTMVVTGPTKVSIDDQIEDINSKLAQNHAGAVWEMVAGRQFYEFKSLFAKIDTTRHEMTSTGANYAGLNLAVNAGLNDRRGIPIGRDVMSMTGTTASFDFNSFTFKQAMIAVPSSAYCSGFADPDRTDQVPVSSIIAQSAAFQFNMEGHRVHHIVLNDFDYFEPGVFNRPAEVAQVYKQYDMSKVNINPLQGFGDIEKVNDVYARLTRKNVNIFKILLNMQMSETQYGLLLSALEEFYFAKGLMVPNAHENPRLTNIVDIDQPDTYPTYSVFVAEFASMIARAEQKGRVQKAENIETLESILKSAMALYPHVLSQTTSISRTNAPQVYYQFKNIETEQLKQIQLVNTIEYIVDSAARGDVIIIHGFDRVYSEVAKMTQDVIDMAKKKGIRFIFAFDSVVSMTSGGFKMNDIMEMRGPFYTNLHTDVDWSMIGKCVGDEVDRLEDALSQTLGETVRSYLLTPTKTNSEVLVHRMRGSVNNFVQINPYL